MNSYKEAIVIKIIIVSFFIQIYFIIWHTNKFTKKALIFRFFLLVLPIFRQKIIKILSDWFKKTLQKFPTMVQFGKKGIKK